MLFKGLQGASQAVGTALPIIKVAHAGVLMIAAGPPGKRRQPVAVVGVPHCEAIPMLQGLQGAAGGRARAGRRWGAVAAALPPGHCRTAAQRYTELITRLHH